MVAGANARAISTPASLFLRISDWTDRLSEWEIALAFYFFALVVRLGAGFLLGINAPPPPGDELGYFQNGLRIIEGRGYARLWPDGVLRPAAGQVPGTSAFIGLGLLLFGKYPASAHLMAILISSFSAPLMYILARRVASREAASLAALACALYPTWVFYSTAILSEAYFIPLLLLSLILAASAILSGSSWTALVAGLSWGAATLVRPHAAPMALLIGVYLLWRSGWRRALLLTFGVALFVAPWVVRNQRIFGSPVLATEGGETFIGSNNPYVLQQTWLHGMWYSTWGIPEHRAAIEFNYNELERSKIQNDLAWAYLRQNPGVIPILAFYKLRRWLTPITVSGGAVRLMVLASYGPLLLFLILGYFRSVYRASVELHLVAMWSLVMIAVTIVYWGNLTRGRLPLEMVWIPWGSLAALDVFKWGSARLRKAEAGNEPLEQPGSAAA